LFIRHFQVACVLANVSQCRTDRPGCFVGRVAGLDRLLPGPERSDSRLQALTVGGKSLLLALQDGKLMTQPGELLQDSGLAGSRLLSQLFVPRTGRIMALPGQLRGSLLKLTDL
jgi:hypothetical protein